MNPAVESHEPTPEFRAHLEWQIASALRREHRFAAPVHRSTALLRGAVVLLAVLATGGIGLFAAEQVREARQRDALVASATAEQSLLRLRLELARAALEETRRGFEVGTAQREALQAAEREVRAMETAIARAKIDVEEIRATAALPRNDLRAPRVAGRDFVRERLLLDLRTAQDTLVAAEQTLARAKVRVEVGTASPAAVLQAETEMVQARAGMQLLQATIELRERAVSGAIKGDAVVAQLRRLELTLQQERLQREIALSSSRLDEVRRLVEVGLATQLDLKRSEVELLEREVQLERLKRELESLRGRRDPL